MCVCVCLCVCMCVYVCIVFVRTYMIVYVHQENTYTHIRIPGSGKPLVMEGNIYAYIRMPGVNTYTYIRIPAAGSGKPLVMEYLQLALCLCVHIYAYIRTPGEYIYAHIYAYIRAPGEYIYAHTHNREREAIGNEIPPASLSRRRHCRMCSLTSVECVLLLESGKPLVMEYLQLASPAATSSSWGLPSGLLLLYYRMRSLTIKLSSLTIIAATWSWGLPSECVLLL